MKEYLKYTIWAVVLGLIVGYLLNIGQEERDYETRLIVVDDNGGEHIKIEEFKSYPNFEITKGEEWAGRGNLYLKISEKEFAFLTIKAEGYKTKRVIVSIEKDGVKEIRMEKKTKKENDKKEEKEEKEEENKEPKEIEKIELKPKL